MIEDPGNYGYYREEVGGLMIGLFEPVCAPWKVGGIPEDFSFGEITPDWDRMGPYVERAMRRVPVSLEVGVRKFFCGPESFTPDLAPIVGEAPELRGAEPLSKVLFDNKLQVVAHALGTHTAISRVQGGRLKAKREIRVASLFREAPPEFLKMIVVHELAHLKESEHNKAFYQLCEHLAPGYAQLEFDARVWLIWRESA